MSDDEPLANTRPDITERLALYWRTYADLPSLALHPETPCYTHGMLIGDTRDARLAIERLRAALEQAQSDLASKATTDSLDGAQEIADEVLGAFTKMHPDVKMNYTQWSDLKEMIEREIMGHADYPGIGAKDLLT